MTGAGQDTKTILKALLLGAVASVATGAGAYGYAWAVEPNWLDVVKVKLTLPNLPGEFDGYRVAQISDIHAGKWMPGARLSRVVDIVNNQQPDLIAITGDFVTQTYLAAPVDIVPTMKRLRAKDGVVAVLGNHDYWGDLGPHLIRRVIRESGMVDLNNDVHTLERDGKLFHVAGVDSYRAGAGRLEQVIAKLSHKGAAMLLAHEPDYADVSARSRRFDLQISGHSHGGQVVIPFAGPPHLPPLGRKYHTGRYQVGDMIQYTNRGLGMVGLPVRFWCRPEITVFTLHARRA
ncbi:MAG TPA: metallophosphoesterase [Chloroflexia bacterium]